MKRIVIFLLIVVLSSACTNNDPFENYMKKGKEHLINGDFENAVKYFDLATIEKPINKDAIALLDRSKSSLNEAKDKEEKERLELEFKSVIMEYKDTRSEIVDNIKEILEALNKPTLGVFSKNDFKEKNKDVRNSLNEIINLERPIGKIIRLKELKKVELDDYLLSAINQVDQFFERDEAQPDSKFNKAFIKFAIKDLNKWVEAIDSYK
jgi:hypothetical protein